MASFVKGCSSSYDRQFFDADREVRPKLASSQKIAIFQHQRRILPRVVSTRRQEIFLWYFTILKMYFYHFWFQNAMNYFLQNNQLFFKLWVNNNNVTTFKSFCSSTSLFPYGNATLLFKQSTGAAIAQWIRPTARVRFPNTPSMLLSICIDLCHVEKTKK